MNVLVELPILNNIQVCEKCEKYISLHNHQYCIICLSCHKCKTMRSSPKDICDTCSKDKINDMCIIL